MEKSRCEGLKKVFALRTTQRSQPSIKSALASKETIK